MDELGLQHRIPTSYLTIPGRELPNRPSLVHRNHRLPLHPLKQLSRGIEVGHRIDLNHRRLRRSVSFGFTGRL
jgi:hypothetical protein